MHDTLIDHLQHRVARMDEQHNGQEQEQPGNTGKETQPIDTIHIHYFPDAIVIVKEGEDSQQQNTTVETTLAQAKHPPVFIAYAICVCYLLLILSCITLQVYCLFNPPIATVTIVPQSQTLTLAGTLQLGRRLHPLTISQSQTVRTTGTGHQSAQAATGTLTLYNGSFSAQTVDKGTVLTGYDGVHVATDETVTIPPANPPTWGIATVRAHALSVGSCGNIAAFDVTSAISNDVSVKNLTAFTNGQDARDYQTVAPRDIAATALMVQTTLAQSVSGALQGQRTPLEQVHLIPCTPTVTSDHRIGQEAPTVTVSVSETCSAVAYNKAEVERKAADLLNRQAGTKIGTAYSLIGNTRVRVTQAAITHTPHPLVFLSFEAHGTWVYALSPGTQQQIKTLIAGKTTHGALQLLMSLPGVTQASLRFSGFGDAARLPKNIQNIHLVLLVL